MKELRLKTSHFNRKHQTNYVEEIMVLRLKNNLPSNISEV